MKRMVDNELKLKSVKIADNMSQVTIPKEAFTNDFYGYFVNIKTINQTSSDGAHFLGVIVNDENLDVGLFRNCTYTIGMFDYNEGDVMVVINGVLADRNDNDSIKPELTFEIPNISVEDALESLMISGSEDYDLYIIKN